MSDKKFVICRSNDHVTENEYYSDCQFRVRCLRSGVGCGAGPHRAMRFW